MSLYLKLDFSNMQPYFGRVGTIVQCTLLQRGRGGGQKSKFENAVFGLKPSYLMLTITLTLCKGGFQLDLNSNEIYCKCAKKYNLLDDFQLRTWSLNVQSETELSQAS